MAFELRSRRRRFVLEALEERLVLDAASLPDIAMVSATTTDSRSIRVVYNIENAPVGQPFDVRFYRSADGQVDSSAIAIGDQIVSGTGLAVGAHDLTAPIAGGVPIDPAHPYVLAVANPDHSVPESDQGNDLASFHVYVIGAVTHGLELTPGLPAWVPLMASALKADGYDVAIPFDWSQTSRLPIPGQTQAAGMRLATAIENAVQSLPANAVIDLHLIGHSRGGAVISQAEIDLQALEASGQHPDLAGLQAGWTRMTFLDPHPAANLPGAAFYSASGGPLGKLVTRTYTTFQADTNDPPAVVPAGVQQSEVYFQHANPTATPNPSEQIFNIWGDVPVQGASNYADLTGTVNGHYEVYGWYQQNVVPLLRSATPFVSPSPRIPPPTHPIPTGRAYEATVLGEAGITSKRVAKQVLVYVGNAERDFSKGHGAAGQAQLSTLGRYIAHQPASKVTPAAAGFFATLLQSFFILPR